MVPATASPSTSRSAAPVRPITGTSTKAWIIITKPSGGLSGVVSSRLTLAISVPMAVVTTSEAVPSSDARARSMRKATLSRASPGWSERISTPARR
ncbi:hypothetical protein [Xanthobacter wiegelii]|uniref:hypothetical protein n=1 Tax=Xanthobacter wiegelii TaxID=3119913 RepID=UPI003729ACBE